MKSFLILICVSLFTYESFAQPLSGSYTVGSNMGMDFFTLTDAAEYLQANGANGSVRFYLEEDIYNQGGVRFENIPGWQDSFELGIYGIPDDNTKVLITSTDSTTLKFKNIKNIVLQDLTVELNILEFNEKKAIAIESESDIALVAIRNCVIWGYGSNYSVSIKSAGPIYALSFSNSTLLSNGNYALEVLSLKTINHLNLDHFFTNAYCLIMAHKLNAGNMNKVFSTGTNTISLSASLIKNITIDSCNIDYGGIHFQADTLDNITIDNSNFSVSDYTNMLQFSGHDLITNVLIKNSAFTISTISGNEVALGLLSFNKINQLFISNCTFEPALYTLIVGDIIEEVQIGNSTLADVEFNSKTSVRNITINDVDVRSRYGLSFLGQSSLNLNNLLITNSSFEGENGIRFREVNSIKDFQCHNNQFNANEILGKGIVGKELSSISNINITNNVFDVYPGGYLCNTGILFSGDTIDNYTSDNNNIKAINGHEYHFNQASNITLINDTIQTDSTAIEVIGDKIKDFTLSKSYISTERGRERSAGIYLDYTRGEAVTLSENEFWGNYFLAGIFMNTMIDTLKIEKNNFQLFASGNAPIPALEIEDVHPNSGILKFTGNNLNLGSGSNANLLVTYGNHKAIITQNTFNSENQSNDNTAIYFNHNNFENQELIVSDNQINNFGSGIIFNDSATSLKINNNEFNNNRWSIYTDGHVVNKIISNNTIKASLSQASQGIISTESGDGFSHIYNNMMMGQNFKGLSIYGSGNTLIEHNTLSAHNTLAMSAIRLSYVSDISLKNNLIQYFASHGKIIEVDSIINEPLFLNNLFYTPTALDTFAIYGYSKSQAISFEEWKAKSSTTSESLLLLAEAPFQDPLNDLHISCAAQLPIFASSSELIEDLDGDHFKSLTQVGADQINYTTSVIDEQNHSFCVNDSIPLVSEIDDAIYRWDNGAKKQIIYSNQNGILICESYKNCILYKQTFNLEKIELPLASFTYDLNDFDLSLKNTSLYSNQITWDLGDNTILYNEDNPIHTYESPGEYDILLISENACGESIHSQEIEVKSPPVSPSSLIASSSTQIQVYPSAANNDINISCPNDRYFFIQILNASGAIVKHGEIYNSSHKTIDISNLEQGIYIIRLITPDSNNSYNATFTKL